jgi:peptidoglycan/xylan/chitin deacetylase (PgdA/CDA1 family)
MYTRSDSWCKILFCLCLIAIAATVLIGCNQQTSALSQSIQPQQPHAMTHRNVLSNTPNAAQTQAVLIQSASLLSTPTPLIPTPPAKELPFKMLKQHSLAKPLQWGENTVGVKHRLVTNNKVVALTFDACGGIDGSGYDKKLIDYLIKEQIPATLFMNGRWIDANPEIFHQLAANPLFEIENHGAEHKPLSVTGKSAYGIKGTSDAQEVNDEVRLNAQKIEKLTGRKPKFFRSGTAYYDEVAVQIVESLGEEAVNFNVLGDAGATFSKIQIVHALEGVKPGSIVISHMNHPEKQTAEGIEASVPLLRKKGYSFVKLEDYELN